MIRIVLASICAWFAGMLSYIIWLGAVWGQSIGHDLMPVAFWSAAAFCVLIPTLYVPAMLLLRRILGGYRPIVWFPLVAMLLGLLPTMLVILVWGGGIGSQNLFSAEASLFYIMFVVVGVVFGLGYAMNRNEAA